MLPRQLWRDAYVLQHCQGSDIYRPISSPVMEWNDGSPLLPWHVRSRLCTWRHLPLFLLLPPARNRLPLRHVCFRCPTRLYLRWRTRIRHHQWSLEACQLEAPFPCGGIAHIGDGASGLLLGP